MGSNFCYRLILIQLSWSNSAMQGNNTPILLVDVLSMLHCLLQLTSGYAMEQHSYLTLYCFIFHLCWGTALQVSYHQLVLFPQQCPYVRIACHLFRLSRRKIFPSIPFYGLMHVCFYLFTASLFYFLQFSSISIFSNVGFWDATPWYSRKFQV